MPILRNVPYAPVGSVQALAKDEEIQQDRQTLLDQSAELGSAIRALSLTLKEAVCESYPEKADASPVRPQLPNRIDEIHTMLSEHLETLRQLKIWVQENIAGKL